ncbi:MAG: glycosyltransferase family 2 protein [Pirellulaceae bacterium]|nr:glycosyltransferase family 2 protein [Pirellulaceae bacterium]
MHVSVIISTYNSPEYLEKVLWGYRVQSMSAFELIVADDGSTPDTLLLLQRFRKSTRMDVRHVWHEDQGFRKCVILNRAIVVSQGDYLILSDGDCIPRWDFVATHLKLAEPGCLLSGGCVRLPRELSQRIGVQDIVGRRVTNAGWLLTQGVIPNKDLLKLAGDTRLGRLLERLTPTQATLNGHNASLWKRDLLRVNGFDERMQYGGLDRELGERLVNAGVRVRQVRHRAVCVHLDHGRPYVHEESWRRNRAIRAQTRQLGVTWTDYGIQRPAAGGADQHTGLSPHRSADAASPRRRAA